MTHVVQKFSTTNRHSNYSCKSIIAIKNGYGVITPPKQKKIVTKELRVSLLFYHSETEIHKDMIDAAATTVFFYESEVWLYNQ